VSADDLRSAVVEAAREMLRLGLVSGSSGNVSARAGEGLLITPAGLRYEHMTEDDLVAVGMDGELAEGQREPSSERRVHLAIYAARPDVGAVVHTHSVHATAWSHLDEPLDDVLTARFAPTGTDEIAAAAVEALGDRNSVLLARHGVVAVGSTPADALDTCVALERQAQIAWLLRG
jgi:ribulose-5-phosphate 4-epimerase/fuculose-1-phosphate aldolase